MAKLWGLPEVNDSWLPDEEAYPPIIRSIHYSMENCLPLAEGQSRSEDQRNIKGIFSKLSLHETTSPELTTTLTEGRSRAQSLAGPEVDLDMDSDNSMLDQSRESFYKMAGEDFDLQRNMHAQSGL